MSCIEKRDYTTGKRTKTRATAQIFLAVRAWSRPGFIRALVAVNAVK
jgi:hypothetical protein